MVVESLIVFTVSLLIGAIGIYAGARVVAGVDSYTYAIITALIGAVVWGGADFSSDGFRSWVRFSSLSRISG